MLKVYATLENLGTAMDPKFGNPKTYIAALGVPIRVPERLALWVQLCLGKNNG